MASFNQSILMGNLTRDVELRRLPAGRAVCEFTIAINERWAGDNGQPRDRVDFINCKAYGGIAETICEYLKKGDGIHVSGPLRYESWEKDGGKRSSLHVEVVRMQMLPKIRSDNRAAGSQEGRGDEGREFESASKDVLF